MIAQTISDENKKKLKDSDVFSAKKDSGMMPESSLKWRCLKLLSSRVRAGCSKHIPQ